MTETTTYVPQPGTIAARAVAIVRALPEGQCIANAVLAERLDQQSSFVIAGMEAPLRYGLVERVKNGRLVSWRRGNGRPRGTLLEPDEVDTDPPRQRIVKAPAVALPDVPRWPGLGEPAQPVALDKSAKKLLDDLARPTGNGPAAVVSPAAPPKGMRVALWSDGTLQIQRSVGDVIVLTVDETRLLVKYLERLGESAE